MQTYKHTNIQTNSQTYKHTNIQHAYTHALGALTDYTDIIIYTVHVYASLQTVNVDEWWSQIAW